MGNEVEKIEMCVREVGEWAEDTPKRTQTPNLASIRFNKGPLTALRSSVQE